MLAQVASASEVAFIPVLLTNQITVWKSPESIKMKKKVIRVPKVQRNAMFFSISEICVSDC